MKKEEVKSVKKEEVKSVKLEDRWEMDELPTITPPKKGK